VATFSIVNKSTKVTDSLVDMAAALAQALNTAFLPAWNPGANAVVMATPVNATPIGTTVTLVDEAPVADAEGYHEAPGGTADIVIQVPDVPAGALASVVSHELFETCADWLAILMVQGTWTPPVAYEVCDPVEDQSFIVEGFSISNFVLPHWFVSGSDGPWDYNGSLKAPFTLSTGGYVALADGSVQWGSDERRAEGLLPWKRGARRVGRFNQPRLFQK
jgi:hypothetical protein